MIIIPFFGTMIVLTGYNMERFAWHNQIIRQAHFDTLLVFLRNDPFYLEELSDQLRVQPLFFRQEYNSEVKSIS